ncbi:MAG: molecular chaperone DnaJ, partial [Cyanobium sp.]
MELPIDHFRLLGVSPTTDVQTVLRTLQQRLDRIPDQGFTLDTLEVRNTLLRQSADLLSDPERRSAYESQLTALSQSGQPLQAGLELGSNQELGGLLLLHEAGQHLEVFELVHRALQPPQAPALGSGREADLCLLAALSCLAGAEDLRRNRRFESAALLLGQGQQLLQRMGQQPQQRQAISEALLALRPFRVLDLLSRDLGAVQARSEGLRLLEELVDERGGLEGQRDPRMDTEEFQAFFRQIRAYLTVQEQIDLFSRWSSAPGQQGGSADFLATTALTASGFAQRKPERIATARSRLLASGQADIQPLLACLHLLLGQVDEAETAFTQGSSAEIRSWAQRAGEDPLAQLCAYCRDWLARDVLPGYRDLDADADLEAYFADRDVQAYLD